MTERSSYVRSRTIARKSSSSSCSPSPSTSRSPVPSASPITRRRSRSAGRTWAIAGIISAATDRAPDVAAGGETSHPVPQPHTVHAQGVELRGRERAVPEPAGEVRAIVPQLLERPLGRRKPRREPARLATDSAVEAFLDLVLRMVETGKRPIRMSSRERGQELHHRESSIPDAKEPGKVLVRAPLDEADRPVEDEGERISELHDAGLGITPDDRVGMERRPDAPSAAAGDEDRVGMRKVPVGTAKSRLCVDPAELPNLDPAVTDNARANVHVSGARRDVHDRPLPERIPRVLEIEDAAVVARIVSGVDAVVEPRASRGAGPLVEAAAAALEEDEQPRWIAFPNPVRVGTPTRALRLAACKDLDPVAERECTRTAAASAAGAEEHREHAERNLHGLRSSTSQASRSARA